MTGNLNELFATGSLAAWKRAATREPLLRPNEQVSLAQAMERGREARESLKASGVVRTREAERELRALVRGHDEARERFILANVRLVMRMAKRYETTGIPFKDLVQQGILGLIKAVDRFDWTKGYQFSTYAMWWIRVELQEAVAGCGMTVLPAKAAADAREIAHWRVEMEAKQGSLDATVDPAAIADLLNLSTQRVREIDAAMVPAIVEISGSDTRAPQRGFESVAILDVLADESRTTAVERATTEKAVAALLGEVDDQRQVQAVSLRFGLDDGQPRTFVQVGKEMGATEAEVKALVRDARRKMRMFSLSPEERDVVCLRTGMTTGRKVGARETAQRLSLHQADADALYRRGQAKVGALPAQFA